MRITVIVQPLVKIARAAKIGYLMLELPGAFEPTLAKS
jgi:hypothetical protein